jgi:hypothetical protein
VNQLKKPSSYVKKILKEFFQANFEHTFTIKKKVEKLIRNIHQKILVIKKTEQKFGLPYFT